MKYTNIITVINVTSRTSLVQPSLSVRSECSDQGLAESRPRTCDRRGDPRRASAYASAAVSAAFDSFSRRLPPSIKIDHLFSQRQVCLKGLDRDQHRRVTVPDKNGKCLVPSLCKVVGPVPVRERFRVHIPHRWWKCRR